MIAAKGLVSLGIAGVLAAQVAAMLPGTDGSWYWPFVNYPMYSEARLPGTTFSFHRIRVTGCDSPADTLVFDAGTLPATLFTLRNIFMTATGGRDGRMPADAMHEARETLGALATQAAGRPLCDFEIREQRFVIGRSGLERADVPWRAVATWESHR